MRSKTQFGGLQIEAHQKQQPILLETRPQPSLTQFDGSRRWMMRMRMSCPLLQWVREENSDSAAVSVSGCLSFNPTERTKAERVCAFHATTDKTKKKKWNKRED